MRKINKIIVHCSDSSFGDVKEIDRWHKQKGWNKIGYHYIILNGFRKSSQKYNQSEDGIIEIGRKEEEIGAHVAGQNQDSIGICLIGVKDFTENQMKTLKDTIKTLLLKHKLHIKDVYGHYEFDDGKTCPNIDMVKF
jgi:hypothetical protein